MGFVVGAHRSGSRMCDHKGTLTNPLLSPRASVLRKGGAHRPSSSAACGEAGDSAQSVSFPSLLGGVGLVVRSVSYGPTPELSLTGADDSAERDERAGWVRTAAATGAGRPGLLGMGWGEGRASLALRTRWRRPRAGRGGHIVHYPFPSQRTQI